MGRCFATSQGSRITALFYWACPLIVNLTGDEVVLHFTVIVSSKNPLSFGVIVTFMPSVSPGGAGCLSYSAAVHPHVVFTSVITNGDVPVFFSLNRASFDSFELNVPKSACVLITSAVVLGCEFSWDFFSVNKLRYNSFILSLCIGLPMAITLFSLSKKNVCNAVCRGKLLSMFRLFLLSVQMSRLYLLRFSTCLDIFYVFGI